MELKNKHNYINLIRGLAIFLMLWGHTIQYCCDGQFDFFENIIFKIVYSFHMPLFMLISGYLFYFSAKKRTLVDLLKHKSNTLLYPILMCSILILFLSDGFVLLIQEGPHVLFSGIRLNDLWFLWSALSSSIALSFSSKLTKNTFFKILLTILGLVFPLLFPCWEMNVYMYPYFIAGYVFATYKYKINKTLINIFGATSTCIYVVMLFFFQKKHYIYTSGLNGGKTFVDSLGIDIFRWAIGLFGSISVAWILFLILVFLKKKSKIISGIELIGENSIALYVLSVPLLSFWLPIIVQKILLIFPVDWNSNIIIYNIIITPVIAIIYSVLLLLITKIMKRIGAYELFFGR